MPKKMIEKPSFTSLKEDRVQESNMKPLAQAVLDKKEIVIGDYE